MFVFTAKVNKKKILIAVLAVLAVILAIILLVGALSRGDTETSAAATVVKNNDDRVDFLRSLGWEVSDVPIETATITIPTDLTGAYANYNELQLSQGFDLSSYAGVDAVRYTYEISNYPGVTDTVVADIIVYRNRIIAGDIQSTALGGFMQGLEFPES